MKRSKLCIPAIILPLILAGCAITQAQILELIQLVVPAGVDQALLRESQNSATVANAIATNMSDAIKTDLIPLVNQGALPASTIFAQVQQRLETATGNGWATTIASWLGTIFQNVNLKAPTMSAAEQTYILAGLNAIASGCDLFLAGKVAMLDGSQMSRSDALACLADFKAELRMNDAVPQPIASCPNGKCKLPDWVQNRTCTDGTCTRCQSGGSHWEADVDHGQGGWVRD